MLRETKKQDTRARIVRQAVELFKLKGFDRVTVDEITAACGIAKGTFFNYFAKKEQVLLHLADAYAEKLRGIAAAHRGLGLKERLTLMLRELLHIYVQHNQLLRLTLLETLKAASSASAAPEGSTNMNIFEAHLAELLEEAQARGNVRAGLDLRAGASVLAAVFYQTLLLAPASEDAEQLAGQLDLRLQLVWEGIGDA
ncbi:TetR family transcriptional regulator [Paenibacillus athensensis]|uniref:HTH tetR-type domain-containing protein n=1 Tax=Paenibacillus athensensis TaxID=1967502 RepID=A0A4Y8Q997_9BACL|nr:TetR/AcrR family transcriptional regulator [Paenibacillus athensensis]MCD1258980.1 TetR family transcriptional regulator [Paenibacillus athensensis]